MGEGRAGSAPPAGAEEVGRAGSRAGGARRGARRKREGGAGLSGWGVREPGPSPCLLNCFHSIPLISPRVGGRLAPHRRTAAPRGALPPLPPLGMEDEVDAFALLDEALQLRKEEEGDDDDIDSEALFANPACSRCVRRGVPTLVALSDGDYHVCFGTECPHAVVDRDKQIVCELSGYVVGAEHKRDGNASWTGRSTTSANPDDSAGTPAGGWARRRDMFAASAHAWLDSATINVDGCEARTPEAAAQEVTPCAGRITGCDAETRAWRVK